MAHLRSQLPDDDALEEAAVLFGALADRNRIKLLHALSLGGELCVCDVAHVLGISVSAASHHLRRLRALRILRHRTEGKMAYYRLRDDAAAKLVNEALTRRAA